VHERKAKDIWQNLYEFYLLETEDAVHWNETTVKQWLEQQLGINKVVVTGISTVQVQQLTHRQVKGQFIRIRLDAVPASLKKYRWATAEELDALPFPKFITQYLHATGLR
jgi:A/G-specific adenine glycosylase